MLKKVLLVLVTLVAISTCVYAESRWEKVNDFLKDEALYIDTQSVLIDQEKTKQYGSAILSVKVKRTIGSTKGFLQSIVHFQEEVENLEVKDAKSADKIDLSNVSYGLSTYYVCLSQKSIARDSVQMLYDAGDNFVYQLGKREKLAWEEVKPGSFWEPLLEAVGSVIHTK